MLCDNPDRERDRSIVSEVIEGRQNVSTAPLYYWQNLNSSRGIEAALQD